MSLKHHVILVVMTCAFSYLIYKIGCIHLGRTFGTTEYYRLPCGRFRLNGLADHTVLTDATIEHHYYNVRLEPSNINLLYISNINWCPGSSPGPGACRRYHLYYTPFRISSTAWGAGGRLSCISV